MDLPAGAALAAYKTASTIARLLPAPVADLTGRVVGLGLGVLDRPRRRMVDRHLTRVQGEAADPMDGRLRVGRAFGSYARYWVEAFRLHGLGLEELDAGMTLEGFDHVEQARAAGTGAILCLPHLGGWEFAGAWACAHGHPVTVVVEPLHPPELFDWFADLRREMGMRVVPLGPDAGTETLAALRRNELVCLLSDRDIGGNGVEVSFFGETTTLPAGPATLALRSGAPILPTAIYFTGGGGHLALFRPPLDTGRQGTFRADVARVTQSLALELEALIRRAPDQWHLMQPNWPSDHV